MNTGIVKTKASGIAVAALIVLGMVSYGTKAATSTDMLYQQYIIDLCYNPPSVIPSDWDIATLATMCMQLGGQNSGHSNVALNFGTVNAGNATGMRKKKREVGDLPEGNEAANKAASADVGGWGVVVTPQYGKSTRTDTDLENGFQAELAGLTLGFDYQASSELVIGVLVGKTNDKATFTNSAGSLKTASTSLMLYGTWLPLKNMSLDGYMGYSKQKLDSQRKVAWYPGTGGGTGFFGDVVGNTDGRQLLGGFSLSYLGEGDIELSPFIGFDYVKSNFKGYSETGTTTLEMHYGDRFAISSLGSIGIRVGDVHFYDWGALSPGMRIAAVHEFQNYAKQINNELVSTPGYGFSVMTDSPDRNYLNFGLGVSAALDSGIQLFLDYEKRTKDKLLRGWSVSFGGLFEF